MLDSVPPFCAKIAPFTLNLWSKTHSNFRRITNAPLLSYEWTILLLLHVLVAFCPILGFILPYTSVGLNLTGQAFSFPIVQTFQATNLNCGSDSTCCRLRDIPMMRSIDSEFSNCRFTSFHKQLLNLFNCFAGSRRNNIDPSILLIHIIHILIHLTCNSFSKTHKISLWMPQKVGY